MHVLGGVYAWMKAETGQQKGSRAIYCPPPPIYGGSVCTQTNPYKPDPVSDGRKELCIYSGGNARFFLLHPCVEEFGLF